MSSLMSGPFRPQYSKEMAIVNIICLLRILDQDCIYFIDLKHLKTSILIVLAALGMGEYEER
jgi:hypothetical protein